jgi:hypothetical protein
MRSTTGVLLGLRVKVREMVWRYGSVLVWLLEISLCGI